MDCDEVQGLLDDFARAIGLKRLELDDTGRVAMTVDEAYTIDIEHDEEEESLLLSVELGALGAEPERSRLIELLRSNYDFRDTDGATLALFGVDNNVLLQRALRLEGLVVGEVVRVFEIFMGTAESLKARIAKPAANEAKTVAPPAFPRGAVRV